MAASSVGTTGVTSATLSPGAGKTANLAGFVVCARATAAAAIAVTVTGCIGGTLNFDIGVAAAPAETIFPLVFDLPLCGSAPGQDITVSLAAVGAGGVTAVTAWGVKE